MKSDTQLNWTSQKMCTGKLYTSNLCSPSLCAQYFSVIYKTVSANSSFPHTQLLFERENIDYSVNKILYFYYLGIEVLNLLPSQSKYGVNIVIVILPFT